MLRHRFRRSPSNFASLMTITTLLITSFVTPASADPKPGSSGRPGGPIFSPRAAQPTPASKSTATSKSKKSTTPKRSTAANSGIGSGARGPAVLEVQSLLQAARYDINVADGSFGDQTFHAVMAFQKANGLDRTGRVGAQTLDAMRAGLTPAPIIPDGGPDRIEVSLPKQYLALYRGGELVRILSISTGDGKPFCTLDPETGETACDKAITPPGSFRVTRRVVGWRESKLGLLYNPLYFNGGIAIHGAPSVPARPASHGCVRIPMVSADYFPTVVPNGTPVYVSDGVTPLRVISSKIAPADAWPGSEPTATLVPPTTLVPGPPSTTTAALSGATTAPGQTTVPGQTTTSSPTPTSSPTSTTSATTTVSTTTLPSTTSIPLAPTLARPLTTTTVGGSPV